MIQRIATAVVLAPSILALVIFAPSWVYLSSISALILACQVELFRLLSIRGVKSYRLTFAVSLFLPWVWVSWPGLVADYILLASFLLFGWCVASAYDIPSAVRNVSANLMVFLYISLPLSLTTEYQSLGGRQLILVLTVVWASDSAAYLVGSRWGTYKITPRLSPKKSLQGAVAAVVAALLVAMLLGDYLLPHWTDIQRCVAGLLLAGSAVLGDFFESVLKRSVGVKDSSRVILGHGGILDLIDSLLFALPAYHLLVILL